MAYSTVPQTIAQLPFRTKARETYPSKLVVLVIHFFVVVLVTAAWKCNEISYQVWLKYGTKIVYTSQI